MKFIYGLIGLAMINLLYGFQETYDVRNMDVETLNLSDIAVSTKSIVLKVPSELKEGSIFDLAIDEEFIFALVFMKENGMGNSKILKFEREGAFIQQIGANANGLLSLFFDEKRKIIGLNNGDTIKQYDFSGAAIGETKAIGIKQLVFNGKHYGVEINRNTIGTPIEYRLIKANENASSRRVLANFEDSDSYVSRPMRFLRQGDDLLLWNFIDKNFLQIRDDSIKVKYELRVDSGLLVRATSMISGNWLIFPTQNQTTRQSIITFMNLKSKETFQTLDRYDKGIMDDLSNHGYIKFYQAGVIYGNVENQIFFLKDVSDIESLKTQYPSGWKVLIIATLK